MTGQATGGTLVGQASQSAIGTRGVSGECALAIPDPVRGGALMCRLAVLRALSDGPASRIPPLGTGQGSGFGGWDGHTRRTEAGAQESNKPCAVDPPRTLSALYDHMAPARALPLGDA